MPLHHYDVIIVPYDVHSILVFCSPQKKQNVLHIAAREKRLDCLKELHQYMPPASPETDSLYLAIDKVTRQSFPLRLTNSTPDILVYQPCRRLGMSFITLVLEGVWRF